MRRGITLIELMLAIVLTVVLITSATQATVVALKHGAAVKASRVTAEVDAQFEAKLKALLKLAYLSTVTTDAASFYIGGDAASGSGSISTGSSQSLTFTILGEKLPAEFAESTDDFETLNKTYGPRGGMTEVSISTTPIGNAPSQNGLFVRRQTPADGDPEQGGYESLLDADIESITFEFWDGTDWATSWDTSSMDTPRLPAAVRVTYTRTGASEKVLTVQIPMSDVTPENPVTVGGIA